MGWGVWPEIYIFLVAELRWYSVKEQQGGEKKQGTWAARRVSRAFVAPLPRNFLRPVSYMVTPGVSPPEETVFCHISLLNGAESSIVLTQPMALR